ncbi:hypothetical protein LTR48_006283 [Friedmanniomyces endolithicus]|uniref:Myb-like domain-containing protein n=1 Tax=Rachicladosporium monterosium TaxID=1507873 RepID=A0ABR0KZG0_9PEZI|nr:hypothetical protein LTR48_006283 [Friedmanniomyces endolithicus]KAK5141123.1 hypothetical protein LTR32_006244 [Rachicladosporium monterosium]
MDGSENRGGSSVVRAPTAATGNSRILSNFVHAILRDNGSELHVVEEVASMLGDVKPLMDGNIQVQIANLESGQQDRADKDALHRAITGRVANHHAMDSLLGNTRARTFLAVVKTMNAQQWPPEEVDDSVNVRYLRDDPRRVSASQHQPALATPEAQAAMLKSLLEALDIVIDEVAGVLAVKQRLRRPSGRRQQDEPSASTGAPTSTSIPASITRRTPGTRPAAAAGASFTRRPTSMPGPASTSEASSTRRPASMSGPVTTATPASETGASDSPAVAINQSNTNAKGKGRAVDEPQSSQRTRAQAANAPWSAKETLAVALAWWDGNLEQDAAKRSGYGTAARVTQHNQWIVTHGRELQVKPGDRSWDALDQRVRNLRKAGTTLAEIQAQAAEEERKAGQQ